MRKSLSTAQFSTVSRPAAPAGFSDPLKAKRLFAVAQDAPTNLDLFRRVYAGNASLEDCVKAFCLECGGMDPVAIRDCRATACPLFQRRPYQGEVIR